MSKQGWKSKMDKGWQLPENLLPENRVCVQFEIPDDQQYAAVVVGLLADLGKWWNWEKGGGSDRRATEVAGMFRKSIYETLCIERYHEMGCNCPDRATWQYRFNSTGELERSTDGGTTWELDPADPRTTAVQFPNLPGDDNDSKRCQAAANVRANMQAKADQLAADATAWADVSGMLGALVALLIFIGVIGSLGALTPLALALGATLLAAGQAAFTAAMTDAVFDDFQAYVYCYMDNDGQLKTGGIAGIVGKLNTGVTGIANTFLVKNVQLLQENGINNMAKTDGGLEADCSSFDDCSDTPEVWVNNDMAHPGEIRRVTPDEDGVYTIQAAGDGGTVNYMNVQFAADYTTYATCNSITDTLYTGDQSSYRVQLRCHDGADDPLSPCVALIQRRGTGNWTWKFTLAHTDEVCV